MKDDGNVFQLFEAKDENDFEVAWRFYGLIECARLVNVPVWWGVFKHQIDAL